MPNDTTYFLFQAFSRSNHGLDEDDHHFISKDEDESNHIDVPSDSTDSPFEQATECQRVSSMEDTKQALLTELIEAVDSAGPGSRNRRSPRSLPPSPQTSWHALEAENISQSLTSSPIISRKRPPLPPINSMSPRKLAGIQRRGRSSQRRRYDGPIAQLFYRLQNNTNQQVPSAGSLQQGTAVSQPAGIMQQGPSVLNSEVGNSDGGARAILPRLDIGMSVLGKRHCSGENEEDQRKRLHGD